ncbi:MAG: trypsin-like serine protease [Xanthobacteraceae bacterium]
MLIPAALAGQHFTGVAAAQPVGTSNLPVRSLPCTPVQTVRRDTLAPATVIDCGPQKKITGGSVAVQEGYVLAIRYVRLSGEQELCSGTLIGPNHVLTAGHCGCGIPESYRVSVLPDVRNHDWTSDMGIVGAPYLFDPSVCSGVLWRGNDLAVLNLSASIKEIPVEPVIYGYPPQLAWDLRQFTAPPNKLTAIGFGYTEASVLGVRMEVGIPVLTPDCADARYSGICSPFSEMILADIGRSTGSFGRDSCGGDSGGPVLLTLPQAPPNPPLTIIVAVTSRAVTSLPQNPLLQCGGGGVYTVIGRKSVHAWFQSIGVPKATETPPPSRQNLPPSACVSTCQ